MSVHATLRISLVVFALQFCASSNAAPKLDISALNNLLQEQFSDISIIKNDNTWIAKSRTMLFLIPGKYRTGAPTGKFYQQEGPTAHGIILTIEEGTGQPMSSAIVPQTIKGLYWNTYINAYPIHHGKSYYWIKFSYGSKMPDEFRAKLIQFLSQKN
ncbi:MAG: hypothetical protein OEY52_02445 [Gammaproteobacteria bacterium]|nr:hypothetical protein [Gammaproteobacteria bacterium]